MTETLQGQTRRGYLHELSLEHRGERPGLAWFIRYWLGWSDSPYRKLIYTDSTGTTWKFRRKNR